MQQKLGPPHNYYKPWSFLKMGLPVGPRPHRRICGSSVPSLSRCSRGSQLRAPGVHIFPSHTTYHRSVGTRSAVHTPGAVTQRLTSSAHPRGHGVSLCAISCRNLIPKLQGAVQCPAQTKQSWPAGTSGPVIFSGDIVLKYNVQTNIEKYQRMYSIATLSNSYTSIWGNRGGVHSGRTD